MKILCQILINFKGSNSFKKRSPRGPLRALGRSRRRPPRPTVVDFLDRSWLSSVVFGHLGRHRFFIIFPTPFFIDFGLILGPKMGPKSAPNPFKIDPKTRSKNFLLLGPIFHRFLMDFAPNLIRKNTQNAVRGVIFCVFAGSTSRSIPTCF